MATKELTEAIPSLILGLLITVENLFVCYIVYRFRRLRTYTNGFIASLAGSDILFGAVIVPLRIYDEDSEVTGYLIAIILMVNIANLLSTTFDRYLAILKPFHYITFMAKLFSKIIIGAWVIPIAVALIPLIWEADPSTTVHTIYLFCILTLGILIPYLLILVAYVKIFREVVKQVKTVPRISVVNRRLDGDEAVKEGKRMATEARVAKVFAVIAAIFVLCWMPFVYMNAVVALHMPEIIPESLPVISWYTLNFSSMVNAPIYAFFKSDFRRALKTVLACKRGQRLFSSDDMINSVRYSATTSTRV